MTTHSDAQPTPLVLLCLEGCHGEFYYPLDHKESPRCPTDTRHNVAVYGDLVIRHYCDDCGDELGLDRAGRRQCFPCELKAAADDA